jgi:hypothetical protein
MYINGSWRLFASGTTATAADGSHQNPAAATRCFLLFPSVAASNVDPPLAAPAANQQQQPSIVMVSPIASLCRMQRAACTMATSSNVELPLYRPALAVAAV